MRRVDRFLYHIKTARRGAHFLYYSYLSNKQVGFNKRVGWIIHPTHSTGGQGRIFNLLHENQQVKSLLYIISLHCNGKKNLK